MVNLEVPRDRVLWIMILLQDKTVLPRSGWSRLLFPLLPQTPKTDLTLNSPDSCFPPGEEAAQAACVRGCWERQNSVAIHLCPCRYGFCGTGVWHSCGWEYLLWEPVSTLLVHFTFTSVLQQVSQELLKDIRKKFHTQNKWPLDAEGSRCHDPITQFFPDYRSYDHLTRASLWE